MSVVLCCVCLVGVVCFVCVCASRCFVIVYICLDLCVFVCCPLFVFLFLFVSGLFCSVFVCF